MARTVLWDEEREVGGHRSVMFWECGTNKYWKPGIASCRCPHLTPGGRSINILGETDGFHLSKTVLVFHIFLLLLLFRGN